MNKFDLTSHGIDDTIGSIITINNTSYSIESLLAEGGEKWVYSIKNLKSGINWFVLKIHKFKPDSAIIQEKLAKLNSLSLMLGNAENILLGECYLTGGAMVEIEVSFSKQIPDVELIAKAIKNKNIIERFRIYDKILAGNPYHDWVLAIKSDEYLRSGKFYEAYDAINNA